ncbi:metalloprotease family protein [Leuconostoc sp. MS02]|uniref:Metalloprotease family protein n=1 Tax=Leuconostoc aquikimchii TaxID=3236804 RepID=A0ABV3S0W1_9LACO
MIDILISHIIWWFIVPVIGAYFISLMSQFSTQWAIRHSSYKIVAVLGFLGVVIHELSHLLVALIFNHKIVNFKLWQISDDGVLGYVNHTYNPKSFYQRLGNVFIGLAPILVLTLVFYALTKITYDSLWQISVIIFFLPSFILGFNLSKADWINFWYGTPFYLIVIIVTSVIEFATDYMPRLF